MALNFRSLSCILSMASSVTLGLPALAAGPDIVHSDIQDTARYGPVGNVYGYAWGSHTCNIGTTSLSWVNGGSPALYMNAYRLSNGRLVQIGIGHGKHACCVANGAGCPGNPTCVSTGTGLRAGCRDIYSAGFNGGVSRLGPRAGANAYDTTLAPIPGGSGDAVWRHVQVSTTDMASTITGALYFAEGFYVCVEEVPSDVLNNASYRRCTVANTGATPTYNWSVTDTTQIGRPAIYAWRDHGLGANIPDPSVHIAIGDCPNEGRFFVAGKVTNLPNNRYRYDYAVYNLNSHRSGASFHVPIAANTSITDVGFKDIDYHSDEPYNNADWASTVSQCSGSEVRWQGTQTFAQNPNANALRFASMYNFWFTANAPPAASMGSVTIGLFRPGTPNSFQVAGVPVPGRPTCAADTDDGSGLGIPDGGTTIEDLLFYLNTFNDGCMRADLDNGTGNGVSDGGVTIEDLLYFLYRFDTGC